MTFSTICISALLALSGCATINGVPQTPCQRAGRVAAIAHDAVQAATDAGARADVISRLGTAADTADLAAAAICAASAPSPAPPL